MIKTDIGKARNSGISSAKNLMQEAQFICEEESNSLSDINSTTSAEKESLRLGDIEISECEKDDRSSMSERNELTASQLSFQKRLIKGFIAVQDGEVEKK